MQASTVSSPPRAAGVAAHKEIILTDVGVRYLLLTEDQRTFKGRVLNALNRTPPIAAQFWALQNINLAFKQGEVTGVIGRNGSGKSTLLRVMARIIAPAVGSVAVTGTVSPLLELGTAFNYELTGRENAYLYGAMLKIAREQMEALLPAIIAFSELGPFFDIPIKTYSSGMLSRLAFAVSTQLDPDILLVDEVLAVGDEAFQVKCFFRIKKLIERGSLVVLVSHSADLVAKLCNRVIYLSQGKVAGDGKPERIISQYRRDASAAP